VRVDRDGALGAARELDAVPSGGGSSAVLALLGDVDAVLGPAAPGAAPKGLTVTGSPVLSRPWQLLGLPAVTVPGHRDAQGMPLGLQLVGHPDRLEGLFSLGHAVEQAARANG
jgi:Asp-tRNA(Asn)/Glu-tRNA(Gln) amidotransferase A subunit family amidase